MEFLLDVSIMFIYTMVSITGFYKTVRVLPENSEIEINGEFNK